jgi:lipopolysaccharide export LptBFGC system permease protein LptF
MKMLTVAATKVGLSTILAVWLPNILFALIALVFYRRAQK